jgi:hypothetical protein
METDWDWVTGMETETDWVKAKATGLGMETETDWDWVTGMEMGWVRDWAKGWELVKGQAKLLLAA